MGKIGLADAAGITRLGSTGRLEGDDRRLRLLLEGLHRLATLGLDGRRLGGLQIVEVVAGEPLAEVGVVGEDILLLRLAGQPDELMLHRAQLANDPVALDDRLEHAGLGHLAGKALDHEDSGLAARHDQVEIALLELILGREGNKHPVDLRQPDTPERPAEGEWRDRQRRRSTVHRQDVAVILLVAGEDRSLDLDLVEEPVGEQRANGTIHETARERLLHRRAPLALEEATGKLARRRRTLAVITGEREEIDTSARCSGRCGHDDRRLRVAHENGPGRLLRQLSRLDGEGVIPDCPFDNRFHENSSFFPSRPTARPVHAVVTRGDGAEAHSPRYRTKTARRPRLGHVPNLQDSTTASANRPERPPQSGEQFPVASPRQQRTAGSIKSSGPGMQA